MSEWIFVGDRIPKNECYVLGWDVTKVTCRVVYRVSDHWYAGDGGNVSLAITHWQPLPEPPKRESSFERWWEKQRRDADSNECFRIIDECCVEVCAAREIWDAAIAASKSPDFVP